MAFIHRLVRIDDPTNHSVCFVLLCILSILYDEVEDVSYVLLNNLLCGRILYNRTGEPTY